GILLPRQRDLPRQQMIRTKSRIDLLKPHEALHHQTRADHQNARQGHFKRHKPVSQPSAVRNRSLLTAFLENSRQVRPRAPKRRRESEDQRSKNARKKRKGEHYGFDVYVAEPRNVGRVYVEQNVRAPRREQDSKPAANETQEHALNQ